MEWRPKILNNKFIILFLVLFSSCTTTYKLSASNCKTFKTNLELGENPDFIYTKRIWAPVSYGEPKVIDISKYLSEKLLNCSDFKNISFTLEENALDGFIGLLPFINSKVLTIKGHTVNSQDGKLGKTKDGSLSLLVHDE